MIELKKDDRARRFAIQDYAKPDIDVVLQATKNEEAGNQTAGSFNRGEDAP